MHISEEPVEIPTGILDSPDTKNIVLDFGIRIAIGLLSVGSTLGFQMLPARTCWLLGFAQLCNLGFSYALEKRKPKFELPYLDFPTLLCAIDVCLASAFLGATQLTPVWGWAVILPSIYGVVRGAQAGIIAVLSTGAILAAEALSTSSGNPRVLVFAVACALATLAVGNSREQMLAEPTESPLTENLLDRERSRQLQDHLTRLERSTEMDLLKLRFHSLRDFEPDRAVRSMIEELERVLEAERVTVCSCHQAGSTVHCTRITGSPSAKDQATVADPDHIKRDLIRLIQTYPANPFLVNKEGSLNFPISHEGKIMGMITVINYRRTAAFVGQILQNLGPILAAVFADSEVKKNLTYRARQAEFLYELAVVERGGQTEEELCGRVCAEVCDLYQLDSAVVHGITGGRIEVVGGSGRRSSILSTMRFPAHTGIVGWVQAGAVEQLILDTYDDVRCDKDEAQRQRVGSSLVLPIMRGSQLYGALEVSAIQSHRLSQTAIEGIRLAAAELSRSLERLEADLKAPAILTETKFRAQLTESQSGHLIHFMVLRRAILIESYGKPALSHAQRRVSHRLLTLLPAGGLLCRTKEGGFLAYHPSSDLGEAQKWANQATAAASLISILNPTTSSQTPFPLTARVANIQAIAAVVEASNQPVRETQAS